MSKKVRKKMREEEECPRPSLDEIFTMMYPNWEADLDSNLDFKEIEEYNMYRLE